MLPGFLRQLLPGTCLLCEAALAPDTDPDLCPHCLAALPWNRPACPRCAEPVDDGPPRVCPQCRRRPPPFTRVVAPLRYEGFPRAWVVRLKDQLGMVEGHVLGSLLADAAERAYGPGERRPDLLVPVPLTARRLARRGHNQAITLAGPVAARLGVPLIRRAVLRRHHGRRQRSLGRLERLRNPSGSFASRRRWCNAPCIGIVDDVMTTGATAAELARVLHTAGAGEVHVLCAARTPLDRQARFLSAGRPGGTLPAS